MGGVAGMTEDRSLTPEQVEQWAHNFSEALGPVVTQLGNALGAFAEEVVGMMRKVLEEGGPWMKQMYDAYYQVYLDYGAPYGKTDEGFLRWVEKGGWDASRPSR